MPLSPSSYNVLFIGVQDLIDNGVIIDNTDQKQIQPIIKMAQDKHIQEVIGTPFMVYLQNGIVSSSLTTNDTFLMDAYMKPTLIWYTVYEGSFYNHFKFQNKGLEKLSGENSQAVSLGELQAYQNKALEDAGFYAQRMLRYLEANYALFPSFVNTPFFISDMHPSFRTGYRCSTYLGNDRHPYDRRLTANDPNRELWRF